MISNGHASGATSGNLIIKVSFGGFGSRFVVAILNFKYAVSWCEVCNRKIRGLGHPIKFVNSRDM